MSKFKKMFMLKNIRNSFWIIGEQIFQMMISLIVGVLIARYLGPDNYGSLHYTASFVAFFSAVATLGMESVVIKKIIIKPEEEGRYLGGCIILRFISSLVSILAITILILVINPGDSVKLALALLQSSSLAFRAVQILDSWFQRHLKSRYVSIGKMSACLAVAGYKIFLLITSKSIIWFALSNTITDLIISIVMYMYFRKEYKKKLIFDISKGFEVLSESYHFIISGLMVAIYGQMDKIMIGQMLNDTNVGLYTTAVVICGMWIFVPTAIIKSFRPLIMELKRKGQEDMYLLRLKQLYSAVIWMCLGASVFVMLFASSLVRVLYGDAYLGAVKVIRIAIWLETFSMIGLARGIWIISENKNRYVKYFLVIGAGVNFVLNIIMIPVMGINGAAIATLITQITTSLIAPLLFKETRLHTKIVIESFIFKWYFERKKR